MGKSKTEGTSKHVSTQVRNYKDNVFCMMYRDKRNLLDLYNALNSTSYDDAEGLEITTIQGQVFIKYKNDASMTFAGSLYMFEQQSTENHCMPLRNLIYVTEVYQNKFPNHDLFRKKLKIPKPYFITFYNGTEEKPDTWRMKLSDMYEVPDREDGSEVPELLRSCSLELEVIVVNINKGHNEEFMRSCRTLNDYMTFVDKVRDKKSIGNDIRTSVMEAVDECIAENVQAEFFSQFREEVIAMSIFEYDEEGHMRVLQEEAREEGIEQGLKQGREQGLEQGREQGMEQGRIESIKNLIKNLKLTIEQAMDALSIPDEERAGYMAMLKK